MVMRPIQILITFCAMIAGASIMHFAMKTSTASSSVDLTQIREEARLGFLDRCALFYVNAGGVMNDPSESEVDRVVSEFTRDCHCLYRAIEDSYSDKQDVTLRLKFTLETQFLLRAFEDNSISRDYVSNYRTVMSDLNSSETEIFQSMVGGYGKEVGARADACILSGAVE